MRLPGFHAERSLARPVGSYRTGVSAFGTGAVGVLPMAPCCDMTDTKQLRVTFLHTACKPLRDFIVAPRADQVLSDVARSNSGPTTPGLGPIGAGIAQRRRTIWDRIFCHTSRGPWDATLVERRACSNYAPVHTLTIFAHGEPVTFVWNGGIGNHPPDVGLVSCRQVSDTRVLCPGALSTCECDSSACGANEDCACNLESQW